ncbi:hydrolase, NUDIX domain containing protein [Acanthamoeba castellanii str. Neff]|uniref:Hydrolase, NUDIX domain containing protein n=1 Tax=Acanthamoeba castellanii (strain ATCC 30010 / Neff) TaxID=1257118 RepID=L8GED5_ACACF|nr:hydrolase, NUDIX domain containing protein [Acanthamoeba castellanii str. Neff]ELR11214.1 hydrolase, NUDIX domain containing protein [Acanthamoeba castellanii str. Neff]
MEALWSAKTALNPLLFNGLKVHTLRTTADDARPRLRFDIGLTDYKRYLATNAAGTARIAELTAAAVEAGHEPHAFLANPIGVDVICRTSDGFLIFLKRSAQVFEATGMWASVGGHPEPHMLLHAVRGSAGAAAINEHPTAREVFDAVDGGDRGGALVVRELFDAALREVEEELGLGADVMLTSATRLLGTFGAAWVEGKVDVVFAAETRLTMAQVRAWLDQVDADKAAAHAHTTAHAESVKRNISPYTRAALDVYLRASKTEA